MHKSRRACSENKFRKHITCQEFAVLLFTLALDYLNLKYDQIFNEYFLSFLQLVILIYWISRYTFTYMNDFQFKANMYRMYWKKIDFDYQGSWSVIYGESCVVLFSCICFIFQTSKWDGKWNLFSQRCLRIFIIPLPKCTFSGPWTR